MRRPDDEIRIYLNESKQFSYSFEDYLERANVQMVGITAETESKAVDITGLSASNGVLSYYARGAEAPGEATIVFKMTTTDSNRCPVGVVKFTVSDPAAL